ncbi:hypothetical protein GCM10027580_28200 [Corynebacterium faecale]|uniref:hypothetical protein n=1 Tax=Bacteria TaxID=2 RepID=UPI0025B3BE0F|nr:hypothetical protein [Corynebacterium faecale]
MTSKKHSATITIRDGALYIEFDESSGRPSFSHSIPLAWANGELAGAVDVSEAGDLLGIELIGLEEEIKNPSSFDF